MMRYLSENDIKRIEKLIEDLTAVYERARETQENKVIVPGFERDAFLGEKEIYSDHIVGCACSAISYHEYQMTAEIVEKIANRISFYGIIEKYPHLKQFIEDENLQKTYPNALNELEIITEIKNILLMMFIIRRTENIREKLKE